MNRLTTRDIKRNIVEVCNCENKLCCEVCNDHNTTCGDCPIDNAFEKLARYEDTGMDPEDVSQIMHMTLTEAAKKYQTNDLDFSNEFANYVGSYDAICVLQNNGILNEEEVQVCEHNLLFQIIQMMYGNIRTEGRTEE